jgi:hypothetical protein
VYSYVIVYREANPLEIVAVVHGARQLEAFLQNRITDFPETMSQAASSPARGGADAFDGVQAGTGAILPSDILRRPGSHRRKNRLYFALRELGCVVRSMFLLRYLSDLELRHVINTATTKSERFNKFVQWVAFGGDSVIA